MSKEQQNSTPTMEDRIDALAETIASTATVEQMVSNIRMFIHGQQDGVEDATKPTFVDDGMIDEMETLSASLVYDSAIYLRRVYDEIEDLGKIVKARLDKATRTACELMGEEGTQSINRHGRLLFLAEEKTITPRISDLLPAGVDPKDSRYKETVAQCKASAKARLIARLEESELSDLVTTGFNSNSLRSRLVGSNADRDENNEPIIPECVVDVVDIGSFYRAKIKKSK